jgi:hypothetical protein
MGRDVDWCKANINCWRKRERERERERERKREREKGED